jgi:hypothetical protein
MSYYIPEMRTSSSLTVSEHENYGSERLRSVEGCCTSKHVQSKQKPLVTKQKDRHTFKVSDFTLETLPIKFSVYCSVRYEADKMFHQLVKLRSTCLEYEGMNNWVSFIGIEFNPKTNRFTHCHVDSKQVEDYSPIIFEAFDFINNIGKVLKYD